MKNTVIFTLVLWRACLTKIAASTDVTQKVSNSGSAICCWNVNQSHLFVIG